MKKSHPSAARLFSVICLTAISSLVIGKDAFITASVNPALRTFNESITFYASFDGHITADLSVGKGTPAVDVKNLQYKEGVWGRALQAQGKDHILYYDARHNIDLLHSGSMILWVAPSDEWTDADDPIELNFAVIRDRGKSLLLGRLPTTEENQALIAVYGPNLADLKTRAAVKNKDTLHWKVGQWHLLVVNWTRGNVQFSVDGSVFEEPISRPPNASPTSDKREYIGIAGNSTAKAPYCVDELMILNRPLTHEEVKAHFQSRPMSKS